MNARLLGIAALVLMCVGAAGAGAYFAVRQNAGTPVEQAAAVTSQPEQGVLETEARLDDPARAPEASTSVPVAEAPAPVSPPPAARPEARSAQPPASRPASRPGPAARPAPRVEPSEPPARAEALPERDAEPQRSEPAPISPEVARAPEPPPAPVDRFEELVVPADAVIGLQMENAVSSATASVEDRVTARVTRDVRVAGQVAIPAGSRVQGSVVSVVRGGKFKERARLGVRFHTLVTDEGSVPLQTEAVFREGESPTGESAAKVSAGAIGGAILGGILGGGKGAAIGGAAGAGAGTAAVMAGGRNDAVLPAGTNVTVRLAQPATVTVSR